MCGIVGYVGDKNAAQILLDSLKKLEYRGYDSAGVAVLDGQKIGMHKTSGRISKLEATLPKMNGSTGIGHTRWATHGAPTKENAHPHLDCAGKIAVVHNGIIENFQTLKEGLIKKGHVFSSDTDTEVIPHLIEEFYVDDLEDAFRKTVSKLEGSYALAILSNDKNDSVLAARKNSPLVIGLGKNENFLASDVPAMLKFTRRVIFLEDGEMAVLEKSGVRISTFDGAAIKKKIQTIDWSAEDAEKAGYEHFMLKEIHEQPRAFRETLAGRISELDGAVRLGNIGLSEKKVKSINRIVIIACGTSFHASIFGKYLLERIVKVPVETQISSEFRYSEPVLDTDTLVVVITQSGETADTISALREAAGQGCTSIAITNVVGSTITREVDGVLYTFAGPEIGVAATKTFAAQIAALYMLAIHLGKIKGTLDVESAKRFITSLKSLPWKIQDALDEKAEVEKYANKFASCQQFFFIGRNLGYPIALEGALKLKEIAYVSAEGYPAGELKHGPLALLMRGVPVVAIATQGLTYDKMLGNIKEAKARDATVIAIANDNDTEIDKFADYVIRTPDAGELFSPVLAAVVLQLFAYYVARKRKCVIDKPRNLAKSVTVE